MRIVITLPPDRRRPGELFLEDNNGRRVLADIPVSGLASGAVAANHGNPDLTPTLPFGNTPLGKYVVAELVSFEGAPEELIEVYGRYGVIVLKAVDGEALVAEAKGRVICIVGAPFVSGDSLPTTAGSLRLRGSDMRRLMSLLPSSAQTDSPIICECTEGDFVENGAKVCPVETRMQDNPLNAIRPYALAGAIALPFIKALSASAQEVCCTVLGSGGGFPSTNGINNGSISFKHIRVQEGGDALEGYVPNSTTGVTIAGGIDLGHLTAPDLQNIGFDDQLVRSWDRYLAPSASAPLVGQAAREVLQQYPLKISLDQAKRIDGLYYLAHAHRARRDYEDAGQLLHGHRALPFTALPRRWRTVLVSMHMADPNFSFGAAHQHSVSAEWDQAIAALREYGSSRSDLNQRAFQNSIYLSQLKTPLPNLRDKS